MNHLIEYLQSPDGIRMTAFVFASIILIAFVHRLLKKDARPVRTLAEAERAPWYAEDYKKFLISRIDAAKDIKQLMSLMVEVDGFLDKHYRQPISRFTVHRLYIEVLDAYAAKETDLTKIKVELCTN